SVSPPRSPPAPYSTTGRILQNLAAWSAVALRPSLLLPDPKCSSYSIGLPDPLLRSNGRDWGEAHLAHAVLRRSLLPPFSDPAFPSAFPPAPPALPSYPSALGPATSPASMAVHSSFENCYPSSRSISLFTCDCTVECVDQGSSSPSLIGDRPSHPIYRLFTSVTNLSHCNTELSAEKWSN